jgi:hypothetical protein
VPVSKFRVLLSLATIIGCSLCISGNANATPLIFRYTSQKTGRVFISDGRREKIVNSIGGRLTYETDVMGDVVRSCANRELRCAAGIFIFAVQPHSLGNGGPYKSDGMVFRSTCLTEINDECRVSAVRFQSENTAEGIAGYFIYERNFGVVSFGTIDPRSGKVLEVFSYRSGTPLLFGPL